MSILDVQTLQNAQTIKSNTDQPPQIKNTNDAEVGRFCRAWAKFSSGSTPVVAAGFNVSSITYLSTGKWRVNFTNALPTPDFSGYVTLDGNYNLTTGIDGYTTTYATLVCRTGAGTLYNPGQLFVAFFA